MTKKRVINEYFSWMYERVYNDKYSRNLSYRNLLSYLFDKDFNYILDMDGNRAEDGVDLRYRFSYEKNYDDAVVATYLDDKPCSMLEMMVALSIRCEENIMDDPAAGNRTGQWFWNMIVSLGLGSMTDDRFDECYADGIIERFLNREYSRNGEGGLFTVKHSRRDMRSMEIWYQMGWYLNEVLEG